MVDLVERLRGYRPATEWGDFVEHTICNEAADEIDRLRKAMGTEGQQFMQALVDEASAEIQKRKAAEAENERLRADAKLLDAIQHESWDLRCFNIPTSGDDFDIGWSVIGHWQAEPHERVVAEVYVDDPRTAIRTAIATKGCE